MPCIYIPIKFIICSIKYLHEEEGEEYIMIIAVIKLEIFSKLVKIVI